MYPFHEVIVSYNYDQINVLTALSDKTLVSDSRDRTLKLWGIYTENRIETFIGNYGPVYRIAKVKNGIFIIFARDQIENPTSMLWDLVSGVCMKNYSGHTEAVISVINMSNIIFVTVISYVTENIWIPQKGRNVLIFPGSSEDGLFPMQGLMMKFL